MFIFRLYSPLVLLVVGLLASTLGVVAAGASEYIDKDDLTLLLQDFLARAGEKAAHERFWAEGLIYTSSRGTQTTKAEILQGFESVDDGESGAAGPVYSAANIQIRLYGSTAVIAFRLVATPAETSGDPGSEIEVQEYFNTGTFLKRDGTWKVVAWQATKIPGD